MAKYVVTLVTSASAAVEVEADSPEAALAAAREADMPSLCHQCSGGRDRPELILGDEWGIPEGEPASDFITEIEG